MQLRAIKTFQGRHGLARTGVVLTVEDSYGNELLRLGLVERFAPQNQAIPEAPSVGKRRATASAARAVGGTAKRSYARQAAHHSPEKT